MPSITKCSAIATAAVLCLAGLGCSAPATKSADTAGQPANAATSEAKLVTFATDIKPILDESCSSCHLEENERGKFNMDTRDKALQPGKNGPRIIPGDGEHSPIIQHVSGAPGVKAMPPKGDRLTAEQIATLKTWIDQGANF